MKFKVIALTFLLGLSSCRGCHKKDLLENETQNQEAYAQAREYYRLSLSQQDSYGYIEPKCDSTTFTALYCIWSGMTKEECPVYQSQSKDTPGLWFRHAEHDCFDSEESQTDNSRDQSLMLAILFWHYRDLKSVEEIIAYGESNGFIMGRSRDLSSELGRSYWPPTFTAIYYELLYRLGGGDRRDERKLLQRVGVPTSGFTSHLQANRILLNGILTGWISDSDVFGELDWLRTQTKKEPNNALYKFIRARFDPDYSFEEGYKTLLNINHFPPKMLPSNHENHCTHYLYQRDEDKKDWIPCKDKKFEIFHGNDFGWAECVSRDGCIRGT